MSPSRWVEPGRDNPRIEVQDGSLEDGIKTWSHTVWPQIRAELAKRRWHIGPAARRRNKRKMALKRARRRGYRPGG